jgi:hypothetical protein
MPESPRQFYLERIPAQWNRALDKQRALGEAGARVYRDLCAVNTSLRVRITDGAQETFFLNVIDGRMETGEAPKHAVFLTLAHDGAALARLSEEAGDSALGFLGGLAGVAGDIKLTRTRLQNLAGLAGTIRFSLTGPSGFSVTTHFGAGEPSAEPQCSISVRREAYDRLKRGEIQLQDAFLSGHVQVDGDAQMAMQLALSVLSPD